MTGTFYTDNVDHLLLPGRPADYLDTPVLGVENRTLIGEREVMLQILRDQTPLPTREAREGYFGSRHLEYWLSGLRDVRKVISATDLEQLKAPRVLDFGGASGRIIRHFQNWRVSSELYLSDINPQHVLLAKRLFGGKVTVLHNRGLPTLPFPEGFLDCVVAFSVFTHIDSEDTAWLMELRRIVKPGGHIYLTIHDQETWRILPNTVIADLSLGNEEFRRYYSETPQLSGRKVHAYSGATEYNCNVFLGPDYIDRHWAPLFRGYSIAPLAHDHQAGITLRV
jgi:SAM-dependent methyltransferase